jgi:hypothetical protein
MAGFLTYVRINHLTGSNGGDRYTNQCIASRSFTVTCM